MGKKVLACRLFCHMANNQLILAENNFIIMKGDVMKRVLFSFALGLVSAFLITACSKDQPTGPQPEVAQNNLDQEFGGFTTNDELPAFGDASLMKEANDDVEVADSFNALGKSSETAGVKSYVVRLTWGKLEGDSTATAVKDWSGVIEVNKGALAVLKTIRFESGDHIILPRPNRKKVDLVSRTQTSYDGIVVTIIDNDSSAAEINGQLTFTLGDFSRTYDFSELDSLNQVEPAGDGYEVSIISRSKEAAPFDGGFLVGHWIKENAHGGIFKGRWINSLGTHAGYLRGIWGVNRNDEKVFYGKYISANGEFKGLLRGRWEYTRNEEHGLFRGEWINRERQVKGNLAGHFKTGRPGSGRGYFHGRWHEQ
jgi:hypothetical protein